MHWESCWAVERNPRKNQRGVSAATDTLRTAETLAEAGVARTAGRGPSALIP